MAEPLRRRVRARLLRGLTRGAGFAPPLALRAALGVAGAVGARTRFGRIARANLERCLASQTTAAERERIVRGVFRHSARILDEWVRLARSAPPGGARSERGAWIESAVEIDPSIAVLERELARGRGAIVVTAHLGNWELLAAALRRRGFRGAVVGLERPNDSSAQWILEMRSAYGVETIPQDSPPRRLLDVLREGRILGLLSDLEVRRLDGAFLPFFRVPALTMTAPAAIARAHRAPLIPIRCVARNAVARGARAADYLLRVDEPLALDVDLGRREATLDLTARMNRLFEEWIRETPEQWAWHQDRWRTAPGEYEAVPLVERRRRTRERRAAREGAPE